MLLLMLPGNVPVYKCLGFERETVTWFYTFKMFEEL